MNMTWRSILRTTAFAAAIFLLFALLDCSQTLYPLSSAAIAIGVGALTHFIIESRRKTSRSAFVDYATNDLRKIYYGQTPLYQPGSSYDDLEELYLESRGILQQMAGRLSSILRKRDENNAVLASMMEGVVAVDSEARILTMNASAQKLLNITLPSQLSPLIKEVIPNSAFLPLIETLLDTQEPLEAEVVTNNDDGTILQVHGSPLQDNTMESLGAVLVFHDVTQLRRLETVRRDFVANVSHELKTPITSIKGFVETLLDGALEDRDDSERFLSIVSRQADRLTTIIEDLLSLSRLEQEDNNHEVAREVASLYEMVDRSCQACLLKAGEKQIAFAREIDRSMLLNVNPHFIEQALINLLTNAVKYSHTNGRITISATQRERSITIAVQDEGIGIPKKDLPRIFERFYRVDRARSRIMGGTGLGLAIVKHIAQAHGGQVRVESVVNRGSTFYISLPHVVVEKQVSAA